MPEARAYLKFKPPATSRLDAAADTARRLDRFGRRVVANARRRVPRRTGGLERSIGYRVTSNDIDGRMDVFATAEHAEWVHDGTRPHDIYPYNAKALRFVMGGRPVFAMRVLHPGTRAQPFLRDAVREELARGID